MLDLLRERNLNPKLGQLDLIIRVPYLISIQTNLCTSNPTVTIGWLDLVQYYATGFKTGSYPPISRDRIFLWGRLYPAQADTPDRVGKPGNWQFVSACNSSKPLSNLTLVST